MFQTIIFEDRYSGSYSGGEWIAVAAHEEPTEHDCQTSRGEWMRHIAELDLPYTDEAWDKAKNYNWWASGNTPDEALKNLSSKINKDVVTTLSATIKIR